MTKKNAPTGRGLRLRASVLAAGIGLAAIIAGPAFADHNGETHPILAGELISNTASVTYKVNNVPQDEVVSLPAEFEVDRVIDVLVAGQTSPDVTPGADATLVYTVTNEGNETQAYALSVHDATNFDGATTIYIDDGDGVYEPGVDVAYDPSNPPELTPGQTITVFVVGATDDTALNDGDIVDADLIAETLEPDTQPTWWDVAENGTFTPNAPVLADSSTANDSVDTIFIDDDYDGTYTSDVAGDAQHSDIASATVASANLVVSKSVIIVNNDGVDCGTTATIDPNAFAIPGACVEYTISVQNNGSSEAQLVAISDTLPAEVTLVSVLSYDGDFGNAETGDVVPSITGVNTVSGTEATLAGVVAPATTGQTVEIVVRATIN